MTKKDKIKRIISRCMVIFFFISCIFYGYILGNINRDTLENSPYGADRIYNASFLEVSMESEPSRPVQDIEKEAEREGHFLFVLSSLIFLFIVLIPLLDFLSTFLCALYDGYFSVRRFILLFIHKKDGRKRP